MRLALPARCGRAPSALRRIANRLQVVLVSTCAHALLWENFRLDSKFGARFSSGVKSVQQKTARRQPRPFSDANQRIGLARALSKLGYCSRNQAWQLIEAGRVRLNGVVRRDPETRVTCGRDRIEVDGRAI